MVGGHLLLDRLHAASLQAWTVDVAPGPDIRKAGNLGLVLEVLRQRVAGLESHAALKQQTAQRQTDQR